MKRYEIYKDSGVQWVGEIPSHWDSNKLKFFADISTGTTPSTANEEYWNEATENWYTPADFNEGDIHLNGSSRKVSAMAFEKSACKVFKKNVVLVVGIGATLGKIGFSRVECSANQQINAIEFYDNVYPLFGAYYLSSLKEVMKSLASAATLAIMNQSVTGSIPFVCPTLAEQKNIATYLDRKVSQIDATIAENEQMLEDLKNYRSAIISEAVTKGLDKNVEMKDSGIEWIGIIPKHWNVSNIGRLFNIKAGGDAKPEFYSSTKDDVHKYPVYTNTREADHVYAFSSYAPFSGNSITVTGRGDIGHAIFRSNEYDAIIRLLVLQPKIEDIIDSRYFAYFIDEKIHFFTDSAAVGQLSAIQISPYKICFPPIKEQRAISNYLDERIAQIDVLTKEIDSQISDLKSYKSALITEAVTGKIDLRDWKPKKVND